MAITKVTSGLISADASSIDLNIDAGTLYLDVSENKVGIGTTSPTEKLSTVGNVNIGNNDSSNPFSYLRIGATQYGAADIKPENYDFHRVGLSFHVDNTADDTINPTEAMRITSAGLVGIGTSSPTSRLSVFGSGGVPVRWGDTSALGTLTYSGSDPIIQSNTGNTLFYQSSTEAMRITSDGAVVVNNSGGDAQIYLGGTSGTARMYLARTSADSLLWNVSNGNIRFGTNDAERMRIDSSGTIAMGGTNASPQPGENIAYHLASDGYALYSGVNATTSRNHAVFGNPNGYIGSITTNGSTTAYNTSSDARLKDVTGEARGLKVINELNPVSYNWKADGKADEGLIAQEVLNIVPNAVSGSEEEIYQMDYSKLVVHLVKGMKEQQTIIDNLTTRIETLENA